jgi:hypothetical protein
VAILLPTPKFSRINPTAPSPTGAATILTIPPPIRHLIPVLLAPLRSQIPPIFGPEEPDSATRKFRPHPGGLRPQPHELPPAPGAGLSAAPHWVRRLVAGFRHLVRMAVLSPPRLPVPG